MKFGKIFHRAETPLGQQTVAPAVAEQSGQITPEVTPEIVAAIGVALKQYQGALHDAESMVLTINRVARVYSPWNSKIYGVMNALPPRVRR
ncbi:hypothetical protein FACS1894159_05660 [Bacteroidia bacterium]|nr:hypothetical protein FACS1894159_05660 [Bacteroidia bacterium]